MTKTQRLNFTASIVALMVGMSTLFVSGQATAAVIFQDGFESGNLGHQENGVTWTSSTRAKVNSLMPKTGAYSLEFTFQGKIAGQDSWSEQRFALDTQYKELWVMYDLYIPGNYCHRADYPDNNKFFDLWAEPYTDPGYYTNFTTTSNKDCTSKVDVRTINNGDPQSAISQPDNRNIITAADFGKWMKIVAHIKVPTTVGSGDGVAQLWKNGIPVLSFTNLMNFGSKGRNYIDAGYILGWSNSGYTQETKFYVDNVVIADSPIGVNPPSAPGNVVVR